MCLPPLRIYSAWLRTVVQCLHRMAAVGMSARQKRQSLVLEPCSGLLAFDLVVLASSSPYSGGAACLSLLRHGVTAGDSLLSGAAVCLSMSVEGATTCSSPRSG